MNAAARIAKWGGMIEGLIETLTEDGAVLGWVRDTARPEACVVEIRYRGRKVAASMATGFRGDLLRQGYGHGHYGFSARLQHGLPPGPCELGLHLPHLGVTAPMAVAVPVLQPPEKVTVAALLQAPASWTVVDLCAAPACLAAEANYRRMGTDRFVDAGFRFVLARWPTKAETRHFTQALARFRLTPEAFLLDLLGSPERADLGADLPSPFDPTFPFALA